MDCRFCGASNPEGAQVCQNCRAPLGEGQVVNAAAVPKKTSRLAITAFVLGLGCLTCIAWPLLFLPAIILGILALAQIKNDRAHLKGTGLALAGIIIPAVMVIVAPIFGLILFVIVPSTYHAKGMAQQVVCRTNLQALGNAMMSYSLEFDSLPTPEAWTDLLTEYEDVSPKMLACPSDATGASVSYAMNRFLDGQARSDTPENTVVLFESNLGRNGVGGPRDVALRHGAQGQYGANILFADGHVEFVREDAISQLLWDPEGL